MTPGTCIDCDGVTSGYGVRCRPCCSRSARPAKEDPTLEEIEAMKRIIQAEWGPREREARDHGDGRLIPAEIRPAVKQGRRRARDEAAAQIHDRVLRLPPEVRL